MLIEGILTGALVSAPAFAQATVRETVPHPLHLVSPTLDPAKAQLARSVAAKLLPAGTTRDLLQAPLNMSVASLAHDYLMMPVERFAAEHGAALPEEGVNGPAVIRVRLLEILDPASQTRSRVISGVIQQMAADAAMSKEPELREALAIAYGQQLSVSELQELDRFLATPVGTKFARTSAMLENDLGVFAARQSINRAIVAALPAIMKRLDEATAPLPKIRDAGDLTEAERKEVGQLLHVDPEQLLKR